MDETISRQPTFIDFFRTWLRSEREAIEHEGYGYWQIGALGLEGSGQTFPVIARIPKRNNLDEMLSNALKVGQSQLPIRRTEIVLDPLTDADVGGGALIAFDFVAVEDDSGHDVNPVEVDPTLTRLGDISWFSTGIFIVRSDIVARDAQERETIRSGLRDLQDNSPDGLRFLKIEIYVPNHRKRLVLKVPHL